MQPRCRTRAVFQQWRERVFKKCDSFLLRVNSSEKKRVPAPSGAERTDYSLLYALAPPLPLKGGRGGGEKREITNGFLLRVIALRRKLSRLPAELNEPTIRYYTPKHRGFLKSPVFWGVIT